MDTLAPFLLLSKRVLGSHVKTQTKVEHKPMWFFVSQHDANELQILNKANVCWGFLKQGQWRVLHVPSQIKHQ